MDLDNIRKPFIWRKKYEEQGVKIDEKQIEAENRRKAEANKIELEKIKERQRKRDLEYQQKLNDNEYLQRQKEAEQHEHWEQEEDDFVLRQHRHRSKIRIRDGRAKPIDLFAHYIDIFGSKPDGKKKGNGYLQEEKIDLSDSPVELLNPCEWFNGLRYPDLQALEPDIKTYMSADFEGNQQYWKDLLDITLNEMAKLQTMKEQSEARGSSASDISAAVVPDVMSLFEGKSIEELDEMETEMKDILKNDDPSIDSSFYRGTLSRLRAHRAKTRLTISHKKNLKRQKDKILNPAENSLSRDNQSVKEEDKRMSRSRLDRDDDRARKNSADRSHEDEEVVGDEVEVERDDEDVDNAPQDRFEELREKCIEDYKRGGYSPKMLRKSQLDANIVCVNFERDYELLNQHRHQICNASSLDEARMAIMTREEREFMTAASQGMNKHEETAFNCEAPIRGLDNRNQTYIWADKYQPRKPRYFNRVHTGFEWNKYNQTHYDIDNPPPKVVQGYKFNIFYPDLIDKSKAPKFTITPCKDDKDFCIIRFSAGPPYEDIAFRIVNREWNNSHKSGYRCQFINNMLQLWFQFKRYRYRR